MFRVNPLALVHVLFHVRNMDRSPIQIVCSACSSSHVSRDAWADWDVASQSWILGAVFDQGFCHRCEQEQKLVELSVERV